MDEPVTHADALEVTKRLLERSRDDDASALEELLARHDPRVLHVVRARLGPQLRHKVDVEGVVQQTIVTAFLSIDRFEYRHVGSFRAWLASIAVIEVRGEVEFLRAAKRDHRRERALESVRAGKTVRREQDRAFESDATAVPDRVAGAEHRARMLIALDELRDAQRDVILMRDVLELPWDEVAERLGRPSAGAATMMHARALAALARYLPVD